MSDYDSDNESWEAANEKAIAWRDALPIPELTPDQRRGLNEALYTFSERNLWIELDGFRIDTKDAILLWAIVERIRNEGFPNELRM